MEREAGLCLWDGVDVGDNHRRLSEEYSVDKKRGPHTWRVLRGRRQEGTLVCVPLSRAPESLRKGLWEPPFLLEPLTTVCIRFSCEILFRGRGRCS